MFFRISIYFSIQTAQLLNPPPVEKERTRPAAWVDEWRTYVDGVGLLGAFLSHSDHLPVQHPGVRQVDEELAVRPPHVQNTVGIIHGGDVRSLRSCRHSHLEVIPTLTPVTMSALSLTVWQRFMVGEHDVNLIGSVILPVTKLTVELPQQLSGGSPHVTMETRKL